MKHTITRPYSKLLTIKGCDCISEDKYTIRYHLYQQYVLCHCLVILLPNASKILIAVANCLRHTFHIMNLVLDTASSLSHLWSVYLQFYSGINIPFSPYHKLCFSEVNQAIKAQSQHGVGGGKSFIDFGASNCPVLASIILLR